MSQTVNDLLLHSDIGHSIDLAHYSNGVVARIIAILNRTDSSLFAQLTQALENMDADSFTVQRLDMLLQTVRALNAQAYEQVGKELTDELKNLSDYEAGYQQQLFNSTIPPQVIADVRIIGISAEQAYAAALARPFQGRLLKEWAKSIEADRMTRIRDTIRMGFLENQTTSQIIQRVRGTKKNKYADGIIEIDRRHAEAVVRTAVSHTAATVRDRFYEANSDLIKAVQWTSTLDSRTSPQCFPAETMVSAIGDLVGVSKRTYTGELIIIRTAGGDQLRATPNHPILTSRGWLPFNEVKPSDKIIHAIGGDSVQVVAGENVSMPAMIGKLADSVFQPSASEVFSVSATAAQFHGDGMGSNGEVSIACFEGQLRQREKSSGHKPIAKDLFGRIKFSVLGFCSNHFGDIFRSWLPITKTTKIDATALKDGIEPTFGALPSEAAKNISGTHSFVKQLDSGFLIFEDEDVMLTAFESVHNASINQEPSDSSCGRAVLAPKRGGALAIPVSLDNVVSISRQFVLDIHVFNLETKSALYIAGGFIVHNCRIRDGLKYTQKEHKPIGHDVPWLAGPGKLHWGCRSTSVPITKSWKELSGVDVESFSPATRASMSGQVPAETTYAEWIRKQSAARQDEILGPTRGKLMREGGLGFDRFTNQTGTWLTLDQIKERDAKAFSKAGLN